MHHKEINVNGKRIAYYESDGKGQTVLFIHGNSMSGLCFKKQLDSSLGKTCRLIALDLPGHGHSAPAQDPQSAYTLPGYATVVSGFVNMLEIHDAVQVGWSLGGHILLEASGQLPGSAGLMLCGAPPIGKPMASDAFIPNPLFHLSFKNDLSDDDVTAVVAGFFWPGSSIPKFFGEEMKRTDGRAREALGLSVAEGTYTDEVAVVANLNKPLAIVQGKKESVANLSYLKNLTIPTLWRREVQIIPGAGHTPQWEQPAIFNQLLREFIEGLQSDA
jgi:pimeloyl-ACP methyl ester carboxylesterase